MINFKKAVLRSPFSVLVCSFVLILALALTACSSDSGGGDDPQPSGGGGGGNAQPQQPANGLPAPVGYLTIKNVGQKLTIGKTYYVLIIGNLKYTTPSANTYPLFGIIGRDKKSENYTLLQMVKLDDKNQASLAIPLYYYNAAIEDASYQAVNVNKGTIDVGATIFIFKDTLDGWIDAQYDTAVNIASEYTTHLLEKMVTSADNIPSTVGTDGAIDLVKGSATITWKATN